MCNFQIIGHQHSGLLAHLNALLIFTFMILVGFSYFINRPLSLTLALAALLSDRVWLQRQLRSALCTEHG